MGIISEIDDSSIDKYESFLGKNVAENLGREYFSGLASSGENKETTGAVVWKLSNVDDFENAKSEFVYFNAENSETAEELLEEYGEKISSEDIEKTFFELPDIPEEIIEVLKENGFKVVKKESMDIFVKLEKITSNKIFMPKKKPKSVLPLSQLDPLRFRQGVTNCLFNGVPGLNDDLAFLPKDWYDEDVSCAFVDDDRVTGFFLVHDLPDGSLMPVLLFASGVDSNKNILDMLRSAALSAAHKYDGSTLLVIRRHDDRTRKLSSYLFPKAKGKIVAAGERIEN